MSPRPRPTRIDCHALLLTAVLSLLSGCGQTPDAPPGAATSPKSGTTPVAKVAPSEAAPTAKSVTAQPVSMRRDRLHQPFKDACVWDQAPDGEQRPPDSTVTGRDVVQLFEKIAGPNQSGGLWDQIRFKNDGSHPRAVIHTKVGDITVELYPDHAPNHVRNFLALAQAGYFEGLSFHRSVREESKEKIVSYLEAGCPKGTGEVGLGSLGYWLKAEISETLKHEEGVLGAAHNGDANAAASKFYVVLNSAPWMDGKYTIFGKIVTGLEVAHTINKRPVLEEEPFDRPREPVVIQRVEVLGPLD